VLFLLLFIFILRCEWCGEMAVIDAIRDACWPTRLTMAFLKGRWGEVPNRGFLGDVNAGDDDEYNNMSSIII